MNLLLLTMAVGMTLFIGDLLHVMSTPPFYGAATLVPIILIAYVFQGWAGMQDVGVLMRERTELITLGNWLSAAVALAGYALLIPRFLGLGAAIATVAAFAVRYATVYAFSQRLWPVRYRWAPVLRQVGVATVVCAVSLLAPRPGSWASIGVRALLFAAYVAALFPLGVLTPDERSTLRRLAREWTARLAGALTARQPIDAAAAETSRAA
jgi:O-antigen/teichoic acid export membrane protein